MTIATALSPLAAHASSACDKGAWRGTLGTSPVSIELNPAEDERPAMGRYYYRSSLGDLTLVRDARTGEWQELDAAEKLTGRLTLNCDANTLNGEWRSVDGTKKLPIAATATRNDDYNAPRKIALKPTVAKTGQIGGRRYEVLTYPVPGTIGTRGAKLDTTHGGIRLIGTTPAITTLNATLWGKAVDAVIDHIDCMAQGRRERGPEAGYESSQTQTVVAWNAAFVVVDTWNEGYCGGAHPWHGNSVTTYRLDTGAEADVSSWVRSDWRSEIPKDSRLGKLLVKAYADNGGNGEEAECRDEVRWMGSSIHPEPKQLVFHTQASYAMTPCAEDVALPIDAVWPYLTPAGQQALKTFR
ncbi:hypothetical protein [Mitsuaria sp. 7]|uniref:hypothetical protein n=1 Tax=Mitsuaria sp. 7 TaxID=1658665 RepID=UPI0012F88507|nr:hypothetical protein [Mitsuaria sp. 7]